MPLYATPAAVHAHAADAARAPAAAPASSDDEISEDDEISVLQARDDEVMRATMQYCGVEDNAELVREITEAASSEIGLLVLCAGLAWSGSTPLSRNYLFKLHDMHGLVEFCWTAFTSGQLKSVDCKLVSSVSPCVACSKLASEPSLIAILRRAQDEELYSSHTANDWLTGAQMQQRYEWHARRESLMKLALLAADRKLARLMSQLEDHKRCQLLISENKIACVHQILAAQPRHGVTPQRIAKQLQAAINGSYIASGNKDDEEFDKALLVRHVAPRLLTMLDETDGFAT